jgi:hypothetical protein
MYIRHGGNLYDLLHGRTHRVLVRQDSAPGERRSVAAPPRPRAAPGPPCRQQLALTTGTTVAASFGRGRGARPTASCHAVHTYARPAVLCARPVCAAREQTGRPEPRGARAGRPPGRSPPGPYQHQRHKPADASGSTR